MRSQNLITVDGQDYFPEEFMAKNHNEYTQEDENLTH